jgi:hypothetical protein
MIGFWDFLVMKEGLLLPNKPAVPGKPRINTTPFARKWYSGKGPKKVPAISAKRVMALGR